MPHLLEILLLAVALAAAALAGARHARRHEHPRYVHHSLGFALVAIVSAIALIFYGPQ